MRRLELQATHRLETFVSVQAEAMVLRPHGGILKAVLPVSRTLQIAHPCFPALLSLALLWIIGDLG